MRIYLDTNVFRDLEKPENQELYEFVMADKYRNFYCFSEAHMQDLDRDKTDKKFADMAFMETIVASNCWYHHESKMRVRFATPREYYDDHIWNTGTDIMTSEDAISVLIRETFRSIPLNWDQLIDKTQLPADFPEDMRSMLLEPVTMLDFMDAMFNLTEDLSTEQPKFKKLLQYFHKTMGDHALYERLGIRGYNGKEVTDWTIFSESFQELVHQRATQKDLYNLVSEMLYTLDIYGIVKGKPKKQKFMSLLNDGKHVYYAAHAHLLVTSDADMIEKAKMIFRIWGWPTNIMTLPEFKEYLIYITAQDISAAAMFAQFDAMADLQTGFEKYTLEESFVQKDLTQWYLGEFNSLCAATARGNTYYYFNQYFPNIYSGIMTIELERVIDALMGHFGMDELGVGKLDRKELEEENWKGREWRVGEMGVLLNFNQGMIISLFKAASRLQQPE